MTDSNSEIKIPTKRKPRAVKITEEIKENVTSDNIATRDLKVEDIRELLKNTKPDDTDMVELINVSFIADEDFILRAPNKDYIEKELRWYRSQSLFVKDLGAPVPKIWTDVSSTKGKINSNYGWCVFSADNGYQYVSARTQLLKDKNTRKAIMIYTRPGMQSEWNTDGMSDFMCTNNVQLFIRNNKLIYIVNQRSCDAVFGYTNDVAWHNYVYKLLLEDLQEVYPEVESEHVNYICGSLHVYPRHQKLLEG